MFFNIWNKLGNVSNGGITCTDRGYRGYTDGDINLNMM